MQYNVIFCCWDYFFRLLCHFYFEKPKGTTTFCGNFLVTLVILLAWSHSQNVMPVLKCLVSKSYWLNVLIFAVEQTSFQIYSYIQIIDISFQLLCVKYSDVIVVCLLFMLNVKHMTNNLQQLNHSAAYFTCNKLNDIFSICLQFCNI